MNTASRPDVRALAVTHGAPPTDVELPELAVVIPTLDGRAQLASCLPALAACDYPKGRVRVIVVDNASRDGTSDWLAREHPEVTVLRQPKNTGFAPATNIGARAADGAALLVFLNNDVRVERGWLRALVGPIVRGECTCTAAKMLSWDGKRIDNAGGGSNFHGIAIAHGYEAAPGPEHDFARKCLFACGGAMAVDALAYRAVGGFDDEFFAYYEDLDLGWRLWLAGHEVHYAPDAVCYHHHSSTTRNFPREMVRVLEARNPLLACLKNYDEEHFQRLLPALLALAVRRAWVMARIGDQRPFRIEHATAGLSPWRRLLDRVRKGYGRHGIGRMGLADLFALNDWLGDWPHWQARRAEVQALRRRPDAEILPLFLKPLWCVEGEPGYVALQAALVEQLGIERMFAGLTYAGPEPHK